MWHIKWRIVLIVAWGVMFALGWMTRDAWGADFWGSYPITKGYGADKDTVFTFHIVRGENEHQWWDSYYNQNTRARRLRDEGGFQVKAHMKENPYDWVLCLIEIPEGNVVNWCQTQIRFVYSVLVDTGGGLSVSRRQELIEEAIGEPEPEFKMYGVPEPVKIEMEQEELREFADQIKAAEWAKGRGIALTKCLAQDYVFTDGPKQMKCFQGFGTDFVLPHPSIGTTRSGYIPIWIAFDKDVLRMDHNGASSIEALFALPEYIEVFDYCH